MKIEAIDDEYVEKMLQETANAFVNRLDFKEGQEFFLHGLCGRDVSKIDMSGLSVSNFKRLAFDTKTKFSKEQMEKFHPDELIKQGKSFSKDIKGLHEKGIDGRGTTIAIIDNCFNSEIEEFNGRVKGHIVFEKVDGKGIVFREHTKEDDHNDEYHGDTAACLAAGKECGIIPKAGIYLFEIAEGTPKTEAIKAILEYIDNNELEIDVIARPGAEKIEKAQLDMLSKKGCTFINSAISWSNFSFGRESEDGTEVVLDEYMKKILNVPCNDRTAAGVKEKILNALILPCTGRTSVNIGEDGQPVYKYNGTFCGASFAITQEAAIFAMAKQLDSSIKDEDIINILKNTAKSNLEGMLYVDLEGFVKEIKERSKIQEQHSKGTKDTQELGKETLEEQEGTNEKTVVVKDMEQQIGDLENKQEKAEKGN